MSVILFKMFRFIVLVTVHYMAQVNASKAIFMCAFLSFNFDFCYSVPQFLSIYLYCIK